MTLYILGAIAPSTVWSPPSLAQATMDLQQKIDTMVRLCVAGGKQFRVTGGGSGEAGISLRAFDLKGNLKGDINIDKSQAEGLVNGIDNAISQVAATEVDKVRDCLKPVRDRVLDILFPPQVAPLPHTTPEGEKAVTSPSQQGKQSATVPNQPVLSFSIQPGPGEAAQFISRALEAEFQRADLILDSNRPTVTYDVEAESRTVGRIIDVPEQVVVTVTRRWTDPTLKIPPHQIHAKYEWYNPNSSSQLIAKKIVDAFRDNHEFP